MCLDRDHFPRYCPFEHPLDATDILVDVSAAVTSLNHLLSDGFKCQRSKVLGGSASVGYFQEFDGSPNTGLFVCWLAVFDVEGFAVLQISRAQLQKSTAGPFGMIESYDRWRAIRR